MENDNNNGGIGSASDMGSIEGSVSADAPGSVSADRSNIESSMSTNNGGGTTDSPQMGTLDLNPMMETPTSGGPIIDSQHTAPIDTTTLQINPLEPTFVASLPQYGQALSTLALSALSLRNGGPGTVPGAITGSTATGTAINGGEHALENVLHDISQGGAQLLSLGLYTTEASQSAPDLQPAAAPSWTPEQSQAWYAQWTPDSGIGGNG